jgi:hypothetical protein
VPGSALVLDLNVGVEIDHSWIGDLIFGVAKKSGQGAGTAIDLWVQACNTAQFEGISTQFDDEGTAVFCNPNGPTPDPGDGNGNIPPLGGDPLSLFDGIDAQGVWSFTINDNFAGDTGSLDQWSLEITTGESNCPLPEPPDNGNGQVCICHFPPGNPENAHTICIGEPAVDTHLGHGDTLGGCDADGSESFETEGKGVSSGNQDFNLNDSDADDSITTDDSVEQSSKNKSRK